MPYCSECGALLPDGSKFCTQCGTATGGLAPPPPPDSPPSAGGTEVSADQGSGNSQHDGPLDLRDRVTEERGLIKNIELAIPGWRGYRKREDLRIADNLLRVQLADRIRDNVGMPIERARAAITGAMELSLVEEAGVISREVRAASDRIRHAEQGYSGISPSYHIREDQLYRLYDYDWQLITEVETMEQSAGTIAETAERGEFAALPPLFRGIRDVIGAFNERVRGRNEEMANLEVFS